LSSVASSVAAAKVSRFRRPTSALEYFAGDYLALLGDADGALNGASGLRQDSVVARSAAPADRAAAAVKQARCQAVAAEDVD
jgi:hypothetical protein